MLRDAGPLERHEIGELCRLSSPSLAGVLSRMEKIGFVQRKRLADDQRRVLVSLTRRSRALASRMAPLIEAVYARIEVLLGKTFRADFYRTLDAIIATLWPRRPPE